MRLQDFSAILQKEEEDRRIAREKWERQYFFVTSDTDARIVKGRENAKMPYEGGPWTSCANGGDSEEECRKKWGITDEPCRECGLIFSTTFCDPTKTEMLTRNICFRCNFWREYFESKDNPRHARINGRHYCVSPRNDKDTQWNGFGGRETTIRFLDGRVVSTNNLWHQGEIPAIWRERLPDNAEFAKNPLVPVSMYPTAVKTTTP